MKKETIAKIIRNEAEGNNTRIGRYTYRADLNTGDILRCPTEYLGRAWITRDGEQYDAWEIVAHA